MQSAAPIEALRLAKAALLTPQAVQREVVLKEIDAALQSATENTRSMLLNAYGKPSLQLRRYAEDLFDVSYKTISNQIYAGTFPVPVFKQGAGWAVHVDDLARHIDGLADEARAQFLKRINSQ